MQATVHRYDEQTRSGSVLQDDGIEVPFDADAFDTSGLRLVRPGQRLTVEVEGGQVTSLFIVGVGGDRPIR
jgi:2-phospho-L-lactate guanylyltransferase